MTFRFYRNEPLRRPPADEAKRRDRLMRKAETQRLREEAAEFARLVRVPRDWEYAEALHQAKVALSAGRYGRLGAVAIACGFAHYPSDPPHIWRRGPLRPDIPEHRIYEFEEGASGTVRFRPWGGEAAQALEG